MCDWLGVLGVAGWRCSNCHEPCCCGAPAVDVPALRFCRNTFCSAALPDVVGALYCLAGCCVSVGEVYCDWV